MVENDIDAVAVRKTTMVVVVLWKKTIDLWALTGDGGAVEIATRHMVEAYGGGAFNW